MTRSISLGANLLRNIGSALAGTLATTLIGIVTFGVLARSLGAEGLGQYRTVLTLVLFAGVAVDFGIYSITLREISRPNAEQGRILGAAAALRICGLAFAVLLLTAIVTIAGYEPTIRYGVFVAGVGWIGYQLNDLMRAVFQFKLKQHLGAIAETAGALATLLLVVGLATVHAGTDEMLAATAAGLFCTAALAWYFAFRLVRFRPRFEWSSWRGLIVSGLPVAGSAVLMTIQLRVDVLLLSVMRTPTDVGLYDGPAKLYEFAALAPHLMGGLMLPLFVRDLASPSGSLEPRLNAAVGISFIFSAIVFAVLFVHAEPIVVLLAGSQFAVSAAALRILGAAAAFTGIASVMRFAGTALDQQGKMLRADLIGVCTAVLVHAILIPRYGFIGAAIGKLTGDTVRALAALVLLRRQFTRTLFAAAGIAATAAAGLTGLLQLAQQYGVHWLIASTVGGTLACGGLFLVPRVRAYLRLLAAS